MELGAPVGCGVGAEELDLTVGSLVGMAVGFMVGAKELGMGADEG